MARLILSPATGAVMVTGLSACMAAVWYRAATAFGEILPTTIPFIGRLVASAANPSCSGRSPRRDAPPGPIGFEPKALTWLSRAIPRHCSSDRHMHLHTAAYGIRAVQLLPMHPLSLGDPPSTPRGYLSILPLAPSCACALTNNSGPSCC
jgi:hypothetical protein